MMSFQHLVSATSTLLHSIFFVHFYCKQLIPATVHPAFPFFYISESHISPSLSPLFPPLAADCCHQLLKSLSKFRYLKLSGVLTSCKEDYYSCPYLPLPGSLVFCPPNPSTSLEIMADEMWCSEASTQWKCHPVEPKTFLTQPVTCSFSYLKTLSPPAELCCTH